ncbi:MAG: hypothetical protein E6J35_00375 [Chloroflexi bacterium]|nr:MAG: hypothetical protein E6J35_00375 [Chloroflexota bacterium]TME88826.1 MAG: hypothetical protein E6I44_05100 [Chloroflexota bacterium]
MRGFALWLNSPVGQVIRDIVEGGIAGALAAVLALQLDVATPQVIWAALLTGFISAAIAVARRKLVGANVPPTPAPGQ